MKTLTYSQGQTLPALTKRQIALRNAIGKDASVKEVEALFAKFEKGVKAQNEWDTQVWGSFSKEQIANMKDIERASESRRKTDDLRGSRQAERKSSTCK